jgi:hypothetical protein
MIDSTRPDIIFGTETWLSPNIRDIEVFPEESKVFRNDRKKKDTDKEGVGGLDCCKEISY